MYVPESFSTNREPMCSYVRAGSYAGTAGGGPGCPSPHCALQPRNLDMQDFWQKIHGRPHLLGGPRIRLARSPVSGERAPPPWVGHVIHSKLVERHEFHARVSLMVLALKPGWFFEGLFIAHPCTSQGRTPGLLSQIGGESTMPKFILLREYRT